MNATYNITDNRLKFWPSTDRLTPEQNAQRKAANFVWWPGRRCFAATWSPQAEDLALSFGIEIEEDDTPDDLEARVERFARYADRDEQDADYAARRALDATTSRRAEQAERTAIKKLDEAQYWQKRIAGAIRHAAHQDAPGTIARRIKGLEADLRKHQKTQKEASYTITLWIVEKFDLACAIRVANHAPIRGEVVLPDGSKDWSAWSALTKGTLTAESAREQSVKHCQDVLDHEARWITHLELRLQYERAYLDVVGGDPATNLGGLKPGDKVNWRGEVCEVVKVNKATIQVMSPSHHWCKNGLKVDKTELKPVEVSDEQA